MSAAITRMKFIEKTWTPAYTPVVTANPPKAPQRRIRLSCRKPLQNISSPGPVTNRDFAREVGRVLGRPASLRAPAFALRLLLGEIANTLLTGQRAVPERALALGFRFRYPELGPALQSALRPQTRTG